jgi:tetratricopeptide (TPR) repeat protein
MNRSITVLLAAILVIFSVSLVLKPVPLPVDMLSTARMAEQSSRSEQPYRAMAFYQLLWAYQPYNYSLYDRIGIEAVTSDDYERGVDLLQSARKYKSITSAGLWNLGKAYAALNQPEQAQAVWQEIPPGSDSYASSVQSLLELYTSTQEWQKALDLLNRAYANTQQSSYLPQMAVYRIFLDPANLPETLSIENDKQLTAVYAGYSGYKQKTENEKAEIWLSTGEYLQKTDQYSLAAEAYRRASELAPNAGLPWGYQALLKLKQKQDGAAEIQQAIHLEPDNARVNILAGLYWQEAGKPEVALVYFDHADRLIPNDPQTLRLRGAAELILGNIDAGLDDYQAAAEVHPDDAEGWLWISRYCLDHQVYLRERGLEAVRKALVAEEKNPAALDLAGQIYWDLGDALLGRQFFEKALVASADYPSAQLHLGIWFLKNNHASEALPLLRAAASQTVDPQVREQAQQVLDGKTE